MAAVAARCHCSGVALCVVHHLHAVVTPYACLGTLVGSESLGHGYRYGLACEYALGQGDAQHRTVDDEYAVLGLCRTCSHLHRLQSRCVPCDDAAVHGASVGVDYRFGSAVVVYLYRHLHAHASALCHAYQGCGLRGKLKHLRER